MNILDTDIASVKIIEPRVFSDQRGYFFESWQQQRYTDLAGAFVQDNCSKSSYGVLRGIHIQHPKGQGKLVQVLVGEVFDVAVDLRRGSPTFGKSVNVILSEDNHRQFYIPPGFGHGFCVTSDTAIFQYKCTEFYSPDNEFTVMWDDPDLAIDWPLENPSLSQKDLKGLNLSEIPDSKLPVYDPMDI